MGLRGMILLSPFFAVAGMSHIADDIAGSHNAAFFQTFLKRGILAQMGVVIVAFFIKTADADTPTVYASKK